ncbi:unnamed protein product [Ectocarpus sp. 6 AP-2014]
MRVCAIRNGPPAKKPRIGPEIMELATAEQYQSFVSSQVQLEVDVSLVMAFKEAFVQIRPLDCRAKMDKRLRCLAVCTALCTRTHCCNPMCTFARNKGLPGLEGVNER